MNIEEGNELIARFMGYELNIEIGVGVHGSDKGEEFEYFTVNHPDFGDGELMMFDTSWDWLMPIVTKINSIENHRYHFIIYQAVAEITDMVDGRCITKSSTTKESPDIKLAVWKAALAFIEWYNEQQEK